MSVTGDLFTMRLHSKILEQQQQKLDKAVADLAAAIDIAERFRDWLAYGHDENDALMATLSAQLEKLRGDV